MKSAVVLVSGGLDSATVLAMAVEEGWRCHALSVDYGQRHRAELAAAAQVARALGAVEHRVACVDLGLFGGSALTDGAIDVPTQPEELKPFLVTHALVGGRVSGSHVSVVQRHGQDNVPASPTITALPRCAARITIGLSGVPRRPSRVRHPSVL